MHKTIPGQRFKLSGVVKHGSIAIKKGTLENKFILTDFKHDIVVLYKGSLPPTFKEGNMMSVGGFLADENDPTLFVGTSVFANHDVSPDKWMGDSLVEKNTSLNMVEPTKDFEYVAMK